MNHEAFYKDLHQHFVNHYPSVGEHFQVSDLRQVLSPYQIELPREVFEKARAAIGAFFQLRLRPDYIDAVAETEGTWLKKESPQAAVLMAYDFHFDPLSKRLGLIEINTNASGFLLSQGLYRHQALFGDALPLLKKSFQEEMTDHRVEKIAILDENPRQQKMFPEFLMYRDLFSAWGYRAEIFDVTDLSFAYELSELVDPLGGRIDFIYNRYTDFLLETPKSSALRKAYFGKSVVLSPHPREYLLLADKKRLVELSRRGALERWGATQFKPISEVLLPTFTLEDFVSADELWKKRKDYFFKPQRSFGAKSTYRGSSITRKVFERVLSEEALVQAFMPAPETERDGQKWKYDLRFFVYRDQIQLGAARVYQGQVTNFQTPGSGFAELKLI